LESGFWNLAGSFRIWNIGNREFRQVAIWNLARVILEVGIWQGRSGIWDADSEDSGSRLGPARWHKNPMQHNDEGESGIWRGLGFSGFLEFLGFLWFLGLGFFRVRVMVI
jgi:hypothetical protein